MAAYFRANKPLTDITAFDADTFRTWLAEHEEIPDGKTVKVKLSESTVKRRCGIAKQFFRAAVRKRLIGESPFAHLKGIGTQSNASRFYFATKEQAEMVLAACPDNQRQLIFAPSRWGGLRCPSEHLALRWCDVDLATGRMIVRCPKTEQHQAKSQRTVPIFPELRPYLEDAQGLAADGAEFVITRYRDAKSNLRTHMERIIKKAGLKLFQNMRSTRQTELAERFPAHVVCQWIGNSPEIAREHYLQSTVAHFEAAAALHNPVQEQATVDDNKLQPAAQVSGKAYCLGVKVGGTGLEPVTPTV